MKVLLFEWASVTNKEMANMLTKYGCTVFVLRLPFNSFSGDTKFLEEFEEYLEKDNYDLVFSINYFDMIGEACHRKRIKYVSWTYDSPTHTGDPKVLAYDTNYVFMFDRLEAESYQKRGFDNVFHLPLAVDYERYSKVRALKRKNIEIIKSDISFVGKLYENNMAEITSNLSDYYKAFLNALVDAQMLVSGYSIFDEIITQEFMQRISNPEFNRQMNTRKRLPWADKDYEEKEPSENMPHKGNLILRLNEAVTNRERLLILQLLAKHHHLKLFSTQKSSIIKNAYMCGPVDYYINMPKVFKYSKINMNISLRSIKSAIPLRCLDIMGCGGLLMSNYQLELTDRFVNGKDLLIYSDPEDALDKANYYLNPIHETERKKIAQNGQEKTKQYYNYKRQLSYIWEKAELGTFPVI